VNPPLVENPPGPAARLVRDRKGGISFRIVALGFALLLALGLTLGFAIHRRYVGFERIAARHVPPDTTFVLRWDVEKVSLFEPTRRFLLPLLDATRSERPVGESRRERVSHATGLQIGRDLREIVILFGPRAGDWAAVLAGSFPKGDWFTPLAGVLKAEGARALGAERMSTPDGLFLARAEDGAFIVASSAARLDAVLPARAIPNGIERTGAGSLVVHAKGAGLPEGAEALITPLGELSELTGVARWGSPLRVELTLHFREQPPADLGARIRRSLEVLLAEDLARLEQRFGRLDVQPAGNREVRVRLSLDDVALGHAANRAGSVVVSGLALRPVLE
jgi:hypothetical protein